MFEFKPSSKVKDDYIEEETIYLEGKKIGDVGRSSSDNKRFKVWIAPHGAAEVCAVAFGDTRDEAFSKALEYYGKQIERAREFLSSIKQSAELKVA